MAIITKKVGKGRYAYLAVREGDKVVHKYLGPANSPYVIGKLADLKEVKMVPERFRTLFWDTDLANISLKKNARYVIERVLEFGSIDAVNWLQRVYTGRTILDAMAESAIVSDKSRNFWEMWFGTGRYA
ncbi:MAG: hypothetical protein HQL08_02955 [Nitrospirae bacterium]|nr:hypothetical protein [Nitrospirota bacterium]